MNVSEPSNEKRATLFVNTLLINKGTNEQQQRDTFISGLSKQRSTLIRFYETYDSTSVSDK